MNVDALVHNWWMMAVRGGLAIVFGLAVLLWPNVTLSIVVMLFAAYAIVDGAWAIAAASRASKRLFGAWPVLLEGLVSVGLGLLALLWPFVPRPFVEILAAWGVATGIFEILAAVYLPLKGAGRWLLATGGFFSLFLAFLVVLLPHAYVDSVVHVIAAYAELFGVVVLLAAIGVARQGRGTVRYTGPHG